MRNKDSGDGKQKRPVPRRRYVSVDSLQKDPGSHETVKPGFTFGAGKSGSGGAEQGRRREGNGRREENSRGKEENSRNKDENSRGKEENSRNKEENSRGKEENSRRKEENSRRKEENSRGKEENGRRKEENSRGKKNSPLSAKRSRGGAGQDSRRARKRRRRKRPAGRAEYYRFEKIVWAVLGSFVLFLGIALGARLIINIIFARDYNSFRYDKAISEEKLLTAVNFPEGYVPFYNIGCAYYEEGDYQHAEAWFRRALRQGAPHGAARGQGKSAAESPEAGSTSEDPADGSTRDVPGLGTPARASAGAAFFSANDPDAECDIRVNTALSIIGQIDPDFLDTESGRTKATEKLKNARNVLTAENCADAGDDGGHDEAAVRLRDEIDEWLNQLTGQQDQTGQGQNSEDNSRGSGGSSNESSGQDSSGGENGQGDSDDNSSGGSGDSSGGGSSDSSGGGSSDSSGGGSSDSSGGGSSNSSGGGGDDSSGGGESPESGNGNGGSSSEDPAPDENSVRSKIERSMEKSRESQRQREEDEKYYEYYYYGSGDEGNGGVWW